MPRGEGGTTGGRVARQGEEPGRRRSLGGSQDELKEVEPQGRGRGLSRVAAGERGEASRAAATQA